MCRASGAAHFVFAERWPHPDMCFAETSVLPLRRTVFRLRDRRRYGAEAPGTPAGRYAFGCGFADGPVDTPLFRRAENLFRHRAEPPFPENVRKTASGGGDGSAADSFRFPESRLSGMGLGGVAGAGGNIRPEPNPVRESEIGLLPYFGVEAFRCLSARCGPKERRRVGIRLQIPVSVVR